MAEAVNPDVTRLFDELTRAALPIAFTKKVLERPPFPFLHKLCVVTLESSGIFSPAQITLGNLVSREQKAGFLVRALAFISFTMHHAKVECLSVLLYVSPVQVLAGVEVSRTYEFLRQLASLYQMNCPDAKIAAAQEVLAKGESHWYTLAMKFRRGLTKMQAAVRLFLKNDQTRRPKPGTKFFKEFEGFGTFEGVVRSVKDGVYVVYYAQDDDEEELDEDEMLEVLRKSHEIEAAAKKDIMPKNEEPPVINTEPINLFSELEHALPSRQRDGITASREALLTRAGPRNTSTSGSQYSEDTEPPPSSKDEFPSPPKSVEPLDDQVMNSDTNEMEATEEPAWRIKLLSLISPEALPGVLKPTIAPTASLLRNPLSHAPPTLPNIAVPGGEAQWRQRLKQPKVDYPKQAMTSNQKKSPPPHKQQPTHRMSPKKKDLGDSLFQEYLTTDQRNNQSKLLRTVVHRIDKYLKRKRMRVIDLFRYCDFDQMGYISRQGLEEVLRQMDIRLPPHEIDAFMAHLDSNKNGVIDVDEFESLVRVHRRTDARRDQLRHELPQVVKNDKIDASKLVPYRDQITHLVRTLDPDGIGTIPAADLAKAIGAIPKMKNEVVGDFIRACRPIHGLIFVADVDRVLGMKRTIKKENRFLDATWLGQFDAQMEKVRGLGA
ncbi:hypothetical protein AC1031_015758 [Aphanomyces cochlioides]|nr:hypothetical protein AC1031_015758 [Aphanomyces cochlioides]